MIKNIIFTTLLIFTISVNAQCISGNCNNGYGIKKYNDGTLYIGDWWNDLPSGHGTAIWPDGSIYVGDFIEGKYNGKGTHFTNQNLYIGEFNHNLPSGNGTLFMNAGSMYVGSFENGDMNGKGYFQHPDGTIEESFWKEGKPTGKVIQEEAKYILRK